ncbi:MAG: DUF4255 domain-containing protein [Geminicoccaceae bacterium]|nr:MAG: DUF4255 domain-containing protein [Geminicoccaceae bacterium]
MKEGTRARSWTLPDVSLLWRRADAGPSRVIDRAVELVAARLNQHLRFRLQSDEDLVLVANVVAHDGTPAPQIEDKLALFVVNIEKDALPPGRAATPLGAGRLGRAQPPLHLNVYLMLAAGYSNGNYGQALKLVSQAIRYLQAHPVFDRRTAPDMGDGLERLTLEVENLGTQELSHLWGVLGGRYLPSVLYRMRTVVLVPDGLVGEVAPVRGVDAMAGS